MFGEDDLVRQHKGRGDLIGNIIVGCFILILARLWYLQIYQGDLFYQFSIENQLRKEIIKAPRGMIFSRNSELLTHNIPRFDAIIIPQYLKSKTFTLKKLANVLEMSVADIEKILKKNRGQARYRPVTIKKNISLKEVSIIETENSKMPGVRVQTFISREYRDGETGAHLLGYISEINQRQLPRYRNRDGYDYKLGDFIGQAGIEEKFDLQLRGDDGFEFVEVDARGRMRRNIRSNALFSGIENKEAVPGNNIRLTVDRDMQIAAFKALEEKVGSAVAVDVNTGEILAMVSRPAFDPTKFSKGLTKEYWSSLVNDERNPLRDRTIQEHYAPGSTFKTFTAIAALEEKIVTAEQELKCGGTYRLGRRVYHDWKRGGHGLTNVYKALRRSVDVYFYQIATQLDIDILAKYAKMFGFGEKTGISLSRETSGLIPTKEWKKKRSGEDWQLGETLSCVIGQSYVLATPLQLAMAYATIGNGGTLYKPYLIKEIFSNSGEIIEEAKPTELGKVEVSKESLKAVQRGLYEVVNNRRGTAYWYRGIGLEMAGKTGTAQVRSMSSKELFSRCEDMPYKDRHHGIFVGYAPYDNPKVAVAAVVEHGCHGSSAAAPVVRDVITTYMKKYMPEAHAKNSEKQRREYRKMLQERKRKEEAKKKREEALQAQEASLSQTGESEE
ncbi:MAG: penicillin-binding protein 2 [Bdellovibrionota bacterium]|jgi:penicillin-binding protein 2|nr:penicillin-binding protein 2 [Bdellovibrionota bacterium]